MGGDDNTTLSLRGAIREETAADGIGAVAAPKHCVERKETVALDALATHPHRPWQLRAGASSETSRFNVNFGSSGSVVRGVRVTLSGCRF